MSGGAGPDAQRPSRTQRRSRCTSNMRSTGIRRGRCMSIKERRGVGARHGALVNVHGHPLEPCSVDLLTDGTVTDVATPMNFDRGMHTVCCIVNELPPFRQGFGQRPDDPCPQFNPGLKPGDGWCVCAHDMEGSG